jgi:hypothetical protein
MPGFPPGRVVAYEELWEELEIRGVPNEHGETKYASVLLQTSDTNGYGDPVRGVVIRVGGFIQGILRKGDSVTVERWVYSWGKPGSKGINRPRWKCAFRLGPEGLPCAAAMREGELEEGMKVDFMGYEWDVGECLVWD